MTPARSRPPEEWQHHLEDEADAAFLYRALAATEADPSRATIFRQLADVEDRHVVMWQQLMADGGYQGKIPGAAPARYPIHSGG